MRLAEEYVKATLHMKEEDTRRALPTCSSASLYGNERELVELVKQGNAAAFAQIYDRHVSLVYRYACTLVGNRSDAEDLTAETFLRALQAIKRYRWTGRPLSSWLLTIARNLGLSQLRRRQRTKDTFRLLSLSTSSDAPEARLAHGLDIQQLRRAIAGLSPAEREVITLRFVLDLDYPRVAEVAGKSVNNVRVIQYRALRKLHKKLALADSPDLLAGPTGERPRGRTAAAAKGMPT